MSKGIVRLPGPWFNIKMPFYQCRKSHCGDKTILRPSYLHNGISYTDKMTSLYWIRAQIPIAHYSEHLYLLILIIHKMDLHHTNCHRWTWWLWISWYHNCSDIGDHQPIICTKTNVIRITSDSTWVMLQPSNKLCMIVAANHWAHTGDCFNLKIQFYQYMNSHYKDRMLLSL